MLVRLTFEGVNLSPTKKHSESLERNDNLGTEAFFGAVCFCRLKGQRSTFARLERQEAEKPFCFAS